MSIESLTGDEFMHFSPDDHHVALGLYDGAVDAAITELAGSQLYQQQRTQLLDRLTSLLTLRKLHRVRLAEQEDEEHVPSSVHPVSQPA